MLDARQAMEITEKARAEKSAAYKRAVDKLFVRTLDAIQADAKSGKYETVMLYPNGLWPSPTNKAEAKEIFDDVCAQVADLSYCVVIPKNESVSTPASALTARILWDKSSIGKGISESILHEA